MKFFLIFVVGGAFVAVSALPRKKQQHSGEDGSNSESSEEISVAQSGTKKNDNRRDLKDDWWKYDGEDSDEGSTYNPADEEDNIFEKSDEKNSVESDEQSYFGNDLDEDDEHDHGEVADADDNAYSSSIAVNLLTGSQMADANILRGIAIADPTFMDALEAIFSNDEQIESKTSAAYEKIAECPTLLELENMSDNSDSTALESESDRRHFQAVEPDDDSFWDNFWNANFVSSRYPLLVDVDLTRYGVKLNVYLEDGRVVEVNPDVVVGLISADSTFSPYIKNILSGSSEKIQQNTELVGGFLSGNKMCPTPQTSKNQGSRPSLE